MEKIRGGFILSGAVWTRWTAYTRSLFSAYRIHSVLFAIPTFVNFFQFISDAYFFFIHFISQTFLPLKLPHKRQEVVAASLT